MTTLGDLTQAHGLLIALLAWAAYVVTLAVQSSREQAEYVAATSEPLAFEEVVTDPPRIDQEQAAMILDRAAARRRESGGSES